MIGVSKSFAALIGQSIFLSGLTFAIASMEMSSRYSVENFSKDQKTLQNAMNALCTFIIIGTVWALAVIGVLYAEYGMKGIIVGVITNLVFMGWIVFSYLWTFKRTANTYGLQMPNFFDFSYTPSAVQRDIRTNSV